MKKGNATSIQEHAWGTVMLSHDGELTPNSQLLTSHTLTVIQKWLVFSAVRCITFRWLTVKLLKIKIVNTESTWSLVQVKNGNCMKLSVRCVTKIICLVSWSSQVQRSFLTATCPAQISHGCMFYFSYFLFYAHGSYVTFCLYCIPCVLIVCIVQIRFTCI